VKLQGASPALETPKGGVLFRILCRFDVCWRRLSEAALPRRGRYASKLQQKLPRQPNVIVGIVIAFEPSASHNRRKEDRELGFAMAPVAARQTLFPSTSATRPMSM
jgi:hypothetical protein